MNVTIDWLRKKQVKGGGTEFDDNVQLREIDPASKTVPRAEPLPHQRMERREVRARINQAIAQLSPEHRAVILMKETEDMQYHEIAEALGCSIGTVMSRLFYARKKRSEEHTSELQSLAYLVCRLLLEKKNHDIHTDAFQHRRN